MSRSTFAKFSMESEDTTDENLDTDQVITEDENGEIAQNDPDDDPEATATDDTDTDPADEPIIFPEIGNLNVDKVAEVLDNEDTRKEVTDDAIEEQRTLTAAVEAFSEQMRLNGTLSPAMLSLAEALHKGAKHRLGAPDDTCKGIGLEGFEKTHQLRPTVKNRSQIALEGFGTMIKSVWEAVVKAIQRAIDWVRGLFSGFFKAAGRSKKITQDTMSAILKIRNTPRYDDYLKKTEINKTHYVTLTPDKHKFLTIDGKDPSEVKTVYYDVSKKETIYDGEPNDYLGAFDLLVGLAKTHDNYPKVFDKNFTSAVVDICKKLSDDVDMDAVPAFCELTPLIPNGYMIIGPGVTYMGMTPSVDDMAFMVNQNYLGDLYIFNQMYPYPMKNYASTIHYLSEWKFEVKTNSNSASNGAMPYMDTDTLKACNQKVLELNNVLDKFELTLDNMTEFHARLKKIAEEMVVDSTEFLKETTTNGTSQKGRSQIYLDLSKMVNNVVSNINVSLVKIATHLGQVCAAWNAYLKEVLMKEQKVVAQ